MEGRGLCFISSAQRVSREITAMFLQTRSENDALESRPKGLSKRVADARKRFAAGCRGAVRRMKRAARVHEQENHATPTRRRSGSHHRRRTKGEEGVASPFAMAMLGLIACLALLQSRDATLRSDNAQLKEPIDANLPPRLDYIEKQLGDLKEEHNRLGQSLSSLSSRVSTVESSTEKLSHQQPQPPSQPAQNSRVGTESLPDFALASAGAAIIGHSRVVPRPAPANIGWFNTARHAFARSLNSVEPGADTLLLTPKSPEPPGDCLPLRGSSGYVDVQLAETVRPSHIAIEHVAPEFAFDRF